MHRLVDTRICTLNQPGYYQDTQHEARHFSRMANPIDALIVGS
jgi:hypothetical protein